MNKDISQLLQASIPFLSPLVFASPALAQIIPDSALPTQVNQITSDGTVPTQVSQTGSVTEITGGAERGNNLFHSFQEFSVSTGNEAFFNNATNIENIFSRVTGGSPSNIDGLIRANGSANLFLLNPAGILFGANARLDIGGSFYGSTADSLLFDEGIEFSAVNPQNPILTINAPIGLRFRDNPEPITYLTFPVNEMGRLIPSIKSNQTFALIGGDINIQDSILTVEPDAKIELGGLSASGTVEILKDGSLDFPEGVEKADIIFTDRATVGINDVGEIGSIIINARNLELSGTSLIFAGNEGNVSALQNRSFILINASDQVFLGGQAAISGNLRGDAVGKIKAIDINTQILEIKSDFSVDEANNMSNAGIFTRAASITALNQTESIIQSEISILTINAQDEILVDKGAIIGQVNAPNGGKRGNAEINTGSFELTNNALVVLNNFSPSQDIGNLKINSDRILVDNSKVSTTLVGIATSNNGTNIDISANSIKVANGAEINAETIGESNAASVIINTDRLTVKDNSQISVSSEDGGKAGELIIKANSVDLNQGTLTASTEAESGGNIILEVDDRITLRNNSQITAQATGDADGGNINIDTDFILAPPNQNSDILASAEEQGTGGRIFIKAEGIFGLEVRPQNDTTNDIDASGGVDGEVIIKTPDVDISKGAIQTPQNVLVLEQIVAQACSSDGIARGNSTLIVNGKGGVPPKLIAPIRSDAIYIEGETVNTQVEIAKKNLHADIYNKKKNKARDIVTLVKSNQLVTIDDIIPAQGAIILENGDVILTAYPTPNSAYRFPDARKNCAT